MAAADCNSQNCVAGKCVLSPPGGKCTITSDCANGQCSAGKCVQAQVGSPCKVPDDCTSGTCTAGKCVQALVGGPCAAPGECTSGTCTAGRCAQAQVGGTCAVPGDCTSGTCTAGKCAQGKPCKTNADCPWGLCGRSNTCLVVYIIKDENAPARNCHLPVADCTSLKTAAACAKRYYPPGAKDWKLCQWDGTASRCTGGGTVNFPGPRQTCAGPVMQINCLSAQLQGACKGFSVGGTQCVWSARSGNCLGYECSCPP